MSKIFFGLVDDPDFAARSPRRGQSRDRDEPGSTKRPWRRLTRNCSADGGRESLRKQRSWPCVVASQLNRFGIAAGGSAVGIGGEQPLDARRSRLARRVWSSTRPLPARPPLPACPTPPRPPPACRRPWLPAAHSPSLRGSRRATTHPWHCRFRPDASARCVPRNRTRSATPSFAASRSRAARSGPSPTIRRSVSGSAASARMT